MVKNPGLGRSPGEGNGNPLQYSCLENPRDRGAWQPTVHGVTKSWTQLSDLQCILQISFFASYAPDLELKKLTTLEKEAAHT